MATGFPGKRGAISAMSEDARMRAERLTLASVEAPAAQPNTKMAQAMSRATRINSRLPAPAWAPGATIPTPSVAAPSLTTAPGAAPPAVGPPAPPRPINAPPLGFAAGPVRSNLINFNTTPDPVPVNATTSLGATPTTQAQPLTTSPGATPAKFGPPAPAPTISAPALNLASGPFRDNRINFNAAPEPTPIKAVTSLGAMPGKAVIPVDAGRAFSPPFAAPAPTSNAVIPIGQPRGFTPPYGASLDPNTIRMPPNTSPGSSLATAGSRGLATTADAGRATISQAVAERAARAARLATGDVVDVAPKPIVAPTISSMNQPGIDSRNAQYAERATYEAERARIENPRGMTRKELFETRSGNPGTGKGRMQFAPPVPNHLNPRLVQANAKAAAESAVFNAKAAVPAPVAPPVIQGPIQPTAAQRALGSGAQWRDALNTAETGRLVRSANPGAIARLAGKAAGVVGAVAKPLAAPLSAYQLYSAASDGRTGEAAWAGADLAASGALFTPAAPAAGAYLGARGLYEGSKMAGNAITSRMSGDTLDAIGGTVNQALKNVGGAFGQGWGVNDDALMANKAETQQAAAAAQLAAQPAKPAVQTIANPYADAPPTNAAPAPTPAPADAPAEDPNAPSGNVTRVGNSYSGNNIAGDITINGQAPRNGGMISAQNQRAFDSLQPLYPTPGEAPRGFTPADATTGLSIMGDTGGYGLRDKGYLERRNAATPLNSITSTRARRTEAAAQLARLDQRDLNTANNASAIERQRMADETTRYSQELSNDTARRGQDVTAAGQMASTGIAKYRAGLEGQELDMKRTTAGFGNRAAARIESLQAAYEAAAPEDRPAIAEQLRVMTGKDTPAEWKAIALQGGMDANGNKTEGVLATVNERTGEARRIDSGQQADTSAPTTKAEYDKLPKGARYTAPDGQVLIKG